ncbi:ABC transporter substrate-binding protein [Megamonas funiformis]|uniref:ABC transporter substrate-binding protein n=1 Tax=Megamonas funiformis TaxID=437897 RepID=UPI00265EABCF|nr:ABC transporter substrate-binding protein [Megamonas funiformis]
MKNNLKLKIGIYITLIVFLLSGCMKQPENNPENQQISYTVTDATNTTLEFSQKPQRIMSMNIAIDEILCELVDTKRIIALSTLADDQNISTIGEKAKTIQGRVTSTNIEQILAYQPDLILVPDYNLNTVKALRSLGLKVYVCKIPTNVSEIFSLMQEISTVVDEKYRGEMLLNTTKSKLSNIEYQLAQNNITTQKKVILLSLFGPLGKQGTFSDVCHFAGVENYFANKNIIYEGVFPEELLLNADADIILLTDKNIQRETILNNPLYQNIPAVKNKAIYYIRGNYLNCTSQNFVESVIEIAHIAYPNINFEHN